ncbi:13392_t:CDS:2 [Acaulospora morrowiae]|uniref:13392_t:CDS:1 n=1 Tax=Acaulospora morrowiae TaxID=94023 RepID=A0A9N8VN85_9GLOM|nr:13392_t:CDS:2 [Acaulospora morrowiae]
MIKNFISNFNLPTGSSVNLVASLNNNNNESMNDVSTSNINTNDLAARDKIVINVGGIKYETYRSTLTSYPNTLLGSIFSCDDNRNPFLDPAHENEFFIDRDGHLFHYIMQFYRTGKVPTIDQTVGLIPITESELEDELEYFKIPTYPPSQFSSATLSPNQLSLRHKMIAAEIDSFTKVLTDTLLTISSQFKKDFFFKRQFLIRFDLTFHHNERISDFNIMPSVNGALKQQLLKNFENFAMLGYAILDRFGEEIGRYMTTTVQGCTWECIKNEDFGWGGTHHSYKIRVGVENSFEHEDVIGNCCLANVGSESGIISSADSILKE